MTVIEIFEKLLAGNAQDKDAVSEFLRSGSREAYDILRSAEFARAAVVNADAMGLGFKTMTDEEAAAYDAELDAALGLCPCCGGPTTHDDGLGW